MIAIIDYGAGNLGSVHKAFRYLGANVEVTRDAAVVARAEGLVLPGVGAFSHCMTGLDTAGMETATKTYLGICVGLQMLFEGSEEPGNAVGLGHLRGRVVRFDFSHAERRPESRPLKIPHIGWNTLKFRPDAPLFAGLDQEDRVYFVHSYFPQPADPSIVSATSDYGDPFCCAVQQNNVHATQFHPEKSGEVGLHILRNFVGLVS
jgi:glutamine amidotransferase